MGGRGLGIFAVPVTNDRRCGNGSRVQQVPRSLINSIRNRRESHHRFIEKAGLVVLDGTAVLINSLASFLLLSPAGHCCAEVLRVPTYLTNRLC